MFGMSRHSGHVNSQSQARLFCSRVNQNQENVGMRWDTVSNVPNSTTDIGPIYKLGSKWSPGGQGNYGIYWQPATYSIRYYGTVWAQNACRVELRTGNWGQYPLPDYSLDWLKILDQTPNYPGNGATNGLGQAYTFDRTYTYTVTATEGIFLSLNSYISATSANACEVWCQITEI